MSEHRDAAHHIADEVAADGEPSPQIMADDRLLLAQFKDEVEQGGATAIRFQMDFTTAFAVVCAIQEACRIIGFAGPTREIAEGFARELEKRIALGPATAAIVARGWDTRYSVPKLERESRAEDVPSAEEWLIWSNEHNAWWRAGGHGYTPDRDEAGRFSHDEALGIVTNANRYLRGDRPNEAMCPGWRTEEVPNES